MSIHEQIKEIIREHGDEIGIIQVAVTSSIASMIYSEYLRNFKQVMKPTMKVMVPKVSIVQEMLVPGSGFACTLSDTLIDTMVSNPLMIEYSTLPELALFRPDKVEILKTIFELSILPNIARVIPAMIVHKFNLDKPDNQLYCQSPDLDIFDRVFPNDKHTQYTADQAVLQLLLIAPNVPKNVLPCESNIDIKLQADVFNVVSVANDNAISVVHFNSQILENYPMRKLLSFVTNTEFKGCEAGGITTDHYLVTSSAFNRVVHTTLLPIAIEG